MTNRIPKKIPVSQMLEYLEYQNGKLYWIKKPSAKVYVGEEAGLVDGQGYRVFWFKGQKYLTHRVIYVIHNGETSSIIDHIDGNKLNNDPSNLRESSYSLNARNLKKPESKSGIRNVYKAYGNKWGVSIKIGEVVFHFGVYEDLELAELVSKEVQDKYYSGAYRL